MTRTVDDVIADLRELLLRKKHGVICMRPDDIRALVVEIEALRAAVRAGPDAEALARAHHEVYWLGPNGDGTCTWDGRRPEDRAADVERMRQALAKAKA